MEIVGIGIATLDVLVRSRELPTWAGGVRPSGMRLEGGGPVATAMVAAERLGVHAGFIGTAGVDELGELKYQSLAREGLDLTHLHRLDGPENEVVLVSVNEKTGERVFSPLDSFWSGFLSPEDLDRQYILSADFLHLDGYHYDAALQAAKWMRQAGKTVVYDGGVPHGFVSEATQELLKYVDVAIGGEGFVESLTGLPDIKDAIAAAPDFGPEIVVQTLGERGCIAISGDAITTADAFDVGVVDTTGAGDAFHGAFIVGMLYGWPVERVIDFASAVAAITCTKLGGRAGLPDMDEVLKFLTEKSPYMWAENGDENGYF